MVILYEKVSEAENKLKGLRDITEEKPLEKGPCIVVIPPETTSLNILSYYLTTVAKLIQLDGEFSYDPNRRIIGLGYGAYFSGLDIFLHYQPTELETHEFVAKFYYPLFMDDGKRVDAQTAMKRVRNVTFVSYCDGAKHFLLIEKALKEMLEKAQYSEQEREQILSQVCFASIAGDALFSNETSTLAITFGDINDRGFNYYVKTYKEILATISGQIIAITGEGTHVFKHILLEEPILSAEIKSFLEASLDNALGNMHSDTLIPMTYEKMDKTLANATEQHAPHL